ncbi:hypothetical protein IVB55_39445 [Bradyrhizobium sp. CW4]|uniref:hypothetical protein n=1 Tax=Bradyrhizobium sp. CW4 TaxID=2782687 RepID=UPI001FFB6168|nr:hypothetical protein [Bradyrhizobium sp. CW4]MCK1418902.1 hypothetical protein [Bradyrhizobium sp. CW4]
MTILKTMQKNIVGAWLLHHDQKLTHSKTTAFESIALAGRSARLLSVITREADWSVSSERVNELANGIGIRKLELPGLLGELERQGLIQQGVSGVSVLGVSQVRLLDHAADIFESQSPGGLERATIELAERGSHSPIRRVDCEEELSDTYRLSSSETDDLFTQSEQIGFVDYESAGTDRLYFNGSLFKRDQAQKAKRVLESLNATEQQRLLEADALLNKAGCVQASELRTLLGETLWSKMHQIAYYEVSVVANEKGQTEFVSKPESLAKYIPNGLADVLDDAKALASSLTYGIVKSGDARGRIKDPSTLIDVLVNRGYVEGWASAIRQDYQVLERRGVVQVTSSSRGNRLTLLKTEVGEMAKDLVLRGDASRTAAEMLIGTQATAFHGPEASRYLERKKDIPEAKAATSRALNILRKTN